MLRWRSSSNLLQKELKAYTLSPLGLDVTMVSFSCFSQDNDDRAGNSTLCQRASSQTCIYVEPWAEVMFVAPVSDWILLGSSQHAEVLLGCCSTSHRMLKINANNCFHKRFHLQLLGPQRRPFVTQVGHFWSWWHYQILRLRMLCNSFRQRCGLMTK